MNLHQPPSPGCISGQQYWKILDCIKYCLNWHCQFVSNLSFFTRPDFFFGGVRIVSVYRTVAFVQELPWASEKKMNFSSALVWDPLWKRYRTFFENRNIQGCIWVRCEWYYLLRGWLVLENYDMRLHCLQSLWGEMTFIDSGDMAENRHHFFVEQAVGHLSNAEWQRKRGENLDTHDKMSKFENANQQVMSGSFKYVCVRAEFWKL